MPAALSPENHDDLLTAHQAKLFAHDLTRRAADGLDRLSMSLFDATVDLNPHQIDAALFALRSPLSQGVLLADEVGLGKTIEAAIVLCQLWAERRRRLLIVCPASLRKQWAFELSEKFNLPSVVHDSKTFREMRAAGKAPLEPGAIVVVSYQFAARLGADLRAVGWDLVVIDEAHKLRNAYKPGSRLAHGLRWATEGRRKLLLTATPLQNSLVELYGLSTLIDERLFGDVDAFKSRYLGAGADLADLKKRLGTFCKRTLRKHVVEYVRYTERRAITRPFRPSDDEHAFYEAVSTFLQREESYALPERQRHLTLLVMRKLLASSPPAIAGTLDTLAARLIALRDTLTPPSESLAEYFLAGDEADDALLDEILDEDEPEEPTAASAVDRLKLAEEIATLTHLAARARAFGVDTKTRNLLKALDIGFVELERTGAPRKAIVFTESRRTQDHLKLFLDASGYTGQVVLFNGTNAGPDARAITEAWRTKNAGTGRVSGSRDVDVRTALVEHFRDSATIMIATEAGAEGLNLQFCSLVVNFDLPWNPQRVEQRIGRCHRYGQRHDVVVVNFLNERNHADQRVLELLTEKFNLFSGVFGASDDVLGAIESGVDFERRVFEVYQACRTPKDIDAAFGALQHELEASISAGLQGSKQKLLEHFDEDVHDRLKLQLASAEASLDRFGRRFWALTRVMLSGNATFDVRSYAFDLYRAPAPDIAPGRYELISRNQRRGDEPALPVAAALYRLSHPLGAFVIDAAKALETPPVHLVFDVAKLSARVHVVEALAGSAGWIVVAQVTIEGADREEHLLLSGFDDAGRSVDGETLERLFAVPATVLGPVSPSDTIVAKLLAESDRARFATVSQAAERAGRHFHEAREKLERWADDKIVALERALGATKDQLKILRRDARQATTTEAQHESQRRLAELEHHQRRQRQDLFAAEDAIAVQRDALIDALERRIAQRVTTIALFTVRWSVIGPAGSPP